MDRMATHDPTFCDITWGAGGTTADLTLEIAGKMQNMVCMLFDKASIDIAVILMSHRRRHADICSVNRHLLAVFCRYVWKQ